MTHHPRKPMTFRDGRAAERYRARKRVLDGAPEGFVQVPQIILAVRSTARQAAADKAARHRLGPAGSPDTSPLTPIARLSAYRLQNGHGRPLTVAQARQVRRNATRAELAELIGGRYATAAELRTYDLTDAERAEWPSWQMLQGVSA